MPVRYTGRIGSSKKSCERIEGQFAGTQKSHCLIRLVIQALNSACIADYRPLKLSGPSLKQGPQ